MAVLSKVIISALIIGFVTEISKRHPTYGGIIAALPLVSLGCKYRVKKQLN